MHFHHFRTLHCLLNTFQSYSQNKPATYTKDSSTSTAVLSRSDFHFCISTLHLSRNCQHYHHNDPSFFLINRTGAPNGEFEGQINLVWRFSSINSHRVFSSKVESRYIEPAGSFAPSSTLILRSQSQ